VKSIFAAKKAKLPGLGEGIYVNELIHEAMLMVDELGANSDRGRLNAFIAQHSKKVEDTKSKKAASRTEKPPILMRLDRSFNYYVRHVPTNTLLLLADFDHP
jgi:hypothetical protein